jgi:GNAT superfamily N-acetyltransferase
MAAPQVGQLDALNAIMKRQLKRHAPRTLCVLGVAGGNGLEHIGLGVQRVYGVDISAEYLAACARRFIALGDRLSLLRMDLSDEACRLPQSGLVIANLVIEYIGIDTFIRRIAEAAPAAVCCAVQDNSGAAFVSASPWADALDCIGNIHIDIGPEALSAAMQAAGYRLSFREEAALPNGKKLVCMDYARDSVQIRELGAEDIPSAMALVWEVFSEFEAPEYSAEGAETFRTFIRPGHIAEMVDAGELRLWGAFAGNSLRGVIAEKGAGHISLFFVKKPFHGQGFGRALFDHYASVCRAEGVNRITVNSSPYAVPIYRRLGFADMDAEQVTSGIRYVPMACNL